MLDALTQMPAGVQSERDLSVWTRLAAGAAAGTVGQTVAYPLDVVRRRMQVTTRSMRQAVHVPLSPALAAHGHALLSSVLNLGTALLRPCCVDAGPW